MLRCFSDGFAFACETCGARFTETAEIRLVWRGDGMVTDPPVGLVHESCVGEWARMAATADDIGAALAGGDLLRMNVITPKRLDLVFEVGERLTSTARAEM